MAERMRNIFFRENFPAAALCAQREEFRIGPVHGNTEPQRQFLLAISCVERNKVGAVRVHDQRADALDQPWAREELVTQRAHRTVHG